MSMFSGSSSSSRPVLSTEETQQKKMVIMQEIRQQLAIANAQQLITSMNEKCYAKCILKPANKLSMSDESCLMRCSDRFLEAFDVVSKTYVSRLAKEREVANASAMGGEGLQ